MQAQWIKTGLTNIGNIPKPEHNAIKAKSYGLSLYSTSHRQGGPGPIASLSMATGGKSLGARWGRQGGKTAALGSPRDLSWQGGRLSTRSEFHS